MNVLVAFLGYKSETCLPKSKCLKSMPFSIFFCGGGGGGVLVNQQPQIRKVLGADKTGKRVNLISLGCESSVV